MQNDIVLQRFMQFKDAFVLSNIPNDVLLELIESYITSDNEVTTVEESNLDGQVSLFHTAS